jgi:hypothetical protein
MSPAKAPARDRVQGIGSDLGDLVLRGGKKLIEEIGEGITPTPLVTRTIDGSSSLTIPVYDPNLSFLRHSLLSEKWDAEVDGLHFRYIGTSKAGKTLTLTLEDRDVAIIREVLGPKRAFREEVTRAEFIKSLVHEANPSLDFFCPQLHDKQPIEKKSQGKKAGEEAKANRGKGIGETKGLTVKGHAADSDQVNLGDDALRIAESVHAPFKVTLALIEALIVETEMGSLDPGNPLQATPASKSESNESDIHRFLTGGWGVDPTGNGAIGYFRANPGASAGEIAQAIQGSKFPERYDGVGKEARKWLEAFGGGTTSTSVTVTEPYEFKVEPKETYWDAIQRLAKEVNWRAFIVAGRFFFIDEIELIRGQVRLAIDQDTDGIENIDFDFNVNKAVTEATVTALVNGWKPPPGAVVTLADYGPASLGSGDAPLRANKQGQVQGISSAVKAKTHEGKGRYLVSAIESPVAGDVEARAATITLKKPTAPLPEPAAQTSTVSASGAGGLTGSAAGNATVERMLQAAENEAAKKRPYAWGGGHDPGFTGPYDCSGGVSFVLHVGGFIGSPLDTTGLAAFGQAGKGSEITVYVKTTGSAEEEHTAIDIAGNVFESGGGGENTNSAGGWGKVDPGQVKAFLTQFDTKRHPAGY